MSEKETDNHYCTQEEVIKRLSELMVGNGEPEKGFIYKVLKMVDAHEKLCDNIEAMRDEINDVKGEVESLKLTISGKKGEEQGVAKTETKNRNTITIILMIITVGVSVASFVITNTARKEMDSKLYWKADRPINPATRSIHINDTAKIKTTIR